MDGGEIQRFVEVAFGGGTFAEGNQGGATLAAQRRTDELAREINAYVEEYAANVVEIVRETPDIAAIPGIGPTIALAVRAWFDTPRNVKDAAITALGQFKDEDEVGLRIFSTGIGPPEHTDYIDLVPTGPIGTNRETIRSKIRGPTRVGAGGTSGTPDEASLGVREVGHPEVPGLLAPAVCRGGSAGPRRSEGSAGLRARGRG